MALSFVQYVGDGATRTFAVPFSYINKAHVSVRVNGTDTPFTWVNSQLVRTAGAPASAQIVEVRRITPSAARVVDFVDGSTLTENDLDQSATQLLYLSQEADDVSRTSIRLGSDGAYDLTGRPMKGVPDPATPDSAVNKKYADANLDATAGAAATAVSAASTAEAKAAQTIADARAAATAAQNAIQAAIDAAFAMASKATIGLCRSPWDKAGVNGLGSGDDTAFLQACIDEIQLLQNNQFISHGVVDGRGGTFRISKPLTMKGNPYQITFQNMALIPADSLTSSFIDLGACTSTSTLKFVNMVFNGYNHVADLLKMGPKTQGTVISTCSFFGFTGRGFLDPSTVAATENRISNCLFQGGSNVNQGTAIELRGNDSEVWDNVILNVSVGVRTLRAGINIMRNHIYSVDPNVPIGAVIADTGDQMCINDNYIDCSYLYLYNPSGAQVHNNKFFMTGTVGGFFPITLRPTAPNQTLNAFSVLGNKFISLFADYYPVNVDTTTGSIGICNQTLMDHNTFQRYYMQATSPYGTGYANNTNNVNFNFAPYLPWGTLKRIWGGAVNSGAGYVTTQTIAGTVGFLNFSATLSGNFTLQGTVNDVFI